MKKRRQLLNINPASVLRALRLHHIVIVKKSSQHTNMRGHSPLSIVAEPAKNNENRTWPKNLQGKEERPVFLSRATHIKTLIVERRAGRRESS